MEHSTQNVSSSDLMLFWSLGNWMTEESACALIV